MFSYVRSLKVFILLLLLVIFTNFQLAATSQDSLYTIRNVREMYEQAEDIKNITCNSDSSALQLESEASSGYIILQPQVSKESFNRGLPSWNGFAPDKASSFAVQMRFHKDNNWSPWLTVGFWKNYIWAQYGNTEYNGGKVDYDYVKLYSYHRKWQFKVIMTRAKIEYPSPRIHKLSFFVSDSRTTNGVDITSIVEDKPEEIFIETDFLCQYQIDDEIGGSICSPTSVAMIIKSFGIEVDPLEFARDTKDPYYGIFGIWPRVVQNASEYGLEGAVTRYRSWSAAREVLAKGGRIAMSVGPPLYGGHLIMLAGFDEMGNPLVHDPAKESGYGYKFNKTELSRSWFEKGGIGYTFYLRDSSNVTGVKNLCRNYNKLPEGFAILKNYPNPFNSRTTIDYKIPSGGRVVLQIFNVNGGLERTLINQYKGAGYHKINWDGKNSEGKNVGSGIYFIGLKYKNISRLKPVSLIK